MTAATVHNISELRAMLHPYRDLYLECDGMTNVIANLLTRQGAVINESFTVHTGYAIRLATFKVVEPHFWIRLPTNKGLATIDYRARMWLGDGEDVPHGVFVEKKGVEYHGATVEGWMVLPDDLADMMIQWGKVPPPKPVLSMDQLQTIARFQW